MRIKSIEKVEKFDVWDISVPEGNCFILENGVVAHNSMYPKAVVSGGCLVAGTQIIMADGSFRAIEDVKIGEMVKTKIGNRKVTNVWNPETLDDGTPECVKLVFSDGFKVTCSLSHKFLGIDGKWIEARYLKEGTQLAMPDDEKIKVVDITEVGQKPVYDIAVAEAEHYVLENGLYSHNSGVMYSANTVFVITKSQEKQGTDLVGYNFTINIEKSRYVREKAKLTFQVLYETGITKYSGLLDIALESGEVIKPSMGWYQKVNMDTGEVIEGKYRAKDTFTDEFWEPILASPHFQQFVRGKYQLGSKQITKNDEDSYVEE